MDKPFGCDRDTIVEPTESTSTPEAPADAQDKPVEGVELAPETTVEPEAPAETIQDTTQQAQSDQPEQKIEAPSVEKSTPSQDEQQSEAPPADNLEKREGGIEGIE